jgi:ABC-type nitrate/sulfonate/bicarbonate transport system substrate-binding protein/nitrogen-specific signal transduction histidine kinase
VRVSSSTNKKLLLLISFLLIATPSFAIDSSLKKVRLQLLWHHQFEFAGFYVAKQKGYYKELGLDVELIEAKPDTNVTKEVVSGRADFGVHNTTLLLDRYAGADVSVVSTVFQHSALALMTLGDGTIKNVHDLRGKNIMIGGDGTEIIAMLKKEGIEPSAYNIIKHDYDPHALTNKKADAMVVFTTNEPFALEKADISYKLFTPDSYGIDFYGNVLFTTSSTLKNDKELVDKFVAASNKGWSYALSNLDESVKITQTYSTKNKDALRYEAEKMVPLVSAEYIPIGFINEGRWRHISDTYARLGMLPQGYLPDGFLYVDDAQAKAQKLLRLIWISVLTAVGIGLMAAYMSYINKKLKKEQKKNEIIMIEQSKRVAVGNLVGNVAHQWRHPLNKISLIVANIKSIIFLNDNIDKTKLVTHLESIDNSVELMSQTISQFNKFYSNSTESEKFALRKVIDDILLLVSDKIAMHGIKIVNLISLSLTIEGHKNNYANVFLSLIQNAIENFEQNSRTKPQITFSIHDIGEFFVISVCDNGGGIDKGKLPDIFEPFTSTKHQGSGMGLAIVKTIVEKKMGGKIKALNTQGGACFEITVPKTNQGTK